MPLSEIWGFLYETQAWDLEQWDSFIACAQEQGCRGIVVVDREVRETTAELMTRIREAGLEGILVFGLDIGNPDLDKLNRAKQMTPLLAVGHPVGQPEFFGTARGVRSHLQFAEKHGYTWICTASHRTICHDIRNGGTMGRELVSAKVMTICFCGYLLMADIYKDPGIPHQLITSTAGHNLEVEYGLTEDTLKEWLKGVRCITGAGFQEGLDCGTMTYAERLGFSGMLIGIPFDLNSVDPLRKHAQAVVIPKIASSPVWKAIVEMAENQHVRIKTHPWGTAKYSDTLRSSRNFVTWGTRRPHSSYVENGRNVLFVENGLLSQASGFYVDDRGYWTDSSLVLDRDWETLPEDWELERLQQHLERWFRWGPGSCCNPDGPIVIALQTPNDAPVQFYCPAREAEDATAFLVRSCAQYLPEDCDVLVRPHPRDVENGKTGCLPFVRPSWEINHADNVYQLLRRCSRLITINSTLATEALGLTMPVAVLGKGTFTGSGAVFDCSYNPKRLSDFLSWTPDPEKIQRYLCSVLRHQLLYSDTDVSRCLPVQKWLQRCTLP